MKLHSWIRWWLIRLPRLPRRIGMFSRERCTRCFYHLLTLTLCLTIFLFYLTYNYLTSAPSRSHQTLPVSPLRQLDYNHRGKYKHVLLWTKFFGSPWPQLQMGEGEFEGCPVDGCLLTQNQDAFPYSDALIFHGRDLRDQRDVPGHPLPGQRWLFLMHESPINTVEPGTWLWQRYLDLSRFDGIFNWTATYRRDSDFLLCYNSYKPRERPLTSAEQKKNFAEGKDRLVLWYVSHCPTDSRREKFAAELSKHISVDIYGKCGRPDPCPRDDDVCVAKLKARYKFYLSLENTNCRDYITEKFWNTIRDGMVPIVLGARPGDYRALAPPHSYIHHLDFPTTKDLATYLLKLDQNDTLYNEYYEWTKLYEYGIDRKCAFFCNLCAALHNTSLPAKVYDKLSNWWNIERDCWSESNQSWYNS